MIPAILTLMGLALLCALSALLGAIVMAIHIAPRKAQLQEAIRVLEEGIALKQDVGGDVLFHGRVIHVIRMLKEELVR